MRGAIIAVGLLGLGAAMGAGAQTMFLPSGLYGLGHGSMRFFCATADGRPIPGRVPSATGVTTIENNIGVLLVFCSAG